jgi:hypothetical protein
MPHVILTTRPRLKLGAVPFKAVVLVPEFSGCSRACPSQVTPWRCRTNRTGSTSNNRAIVQRATCASG